MNNGRETTNEVEQLDPVSLSAFGPTPVLVRGLAETLPYTALSWENFERLLHRLAHQVRGWNDVHTYGKRGQKQFGIDVVGRQPDSSRGTIQSKRYESFDEADMIAALEKFDPEGLPVKKVERLIVATSHVADRRQIIDALSALQDELEATGSSLKLEFWNAAALDDMLRDRADIVTEFFGGAAAEEFCGYRAPLTPPPSPQHAAIAEMVVLGPTSEPAVAEAVGRAVMHTDVGEFSEAADALAEARTLLLGKGFVAHASMLDKQYIDALVASGRRAEAASIASRAYWEAAEAGDGSAAESARSRLHDIVSGAAAQSAAASEKTPTTDASGNTTAGRETDDITEPHDAASVLKDLAEVGYAVMRQPIGTVDDALGTIDLASLIARAKAVPETLDFAGRMMAYLTEVSQAQPIDRWAADNHHLVRQALEVLEPSDADEARGFARHRLEMSLAAVDGWNTLLESAARRRMTRFQRATVRARAALAAAESGDFDTADLLWQDAVEDACLDGHNEDAAEWVFSRRNVKQAIAGGSFQGYEGVFEDHRLAVALRHLGGGVRQPAVRRAAAEAAEAARDEKHRLAGIAGHAYLRLAYVTGSWRQVSDALHALARTYETSGEPLTALRHLVAAGAAKEGADLLEEHTDGFLDVTEFLGHPSPPVARAALRAISTQADLVPDDMVDSVVSFSMRLVDEAVAAGALRPAEHGRYLAALDVLAGLGDRTTFATAEELVSRFAPVLERSPGQHFTTDEATLRILDGVGRGHAALRPTVAERVVQFMLIDEDCARDMRKCATRTLQLASDTVAPLLREVAKTSRSAAEMLSRVQANPGLDPASDPVTEARARLLAEPDLVEGVAYFGSGSVSDSLLLCDGPIEERRELISALLRRVEDEPAIKSGNWPDYLIAAYNLAHPLGPASDLFARALALASQPTAPDPEGLGDESPLAFFRTSGLKRDPRPAAAAVAARLASTAAERREVGNQCQAMTPWRGADGDHLALAFGALPDFQDVVLLVNQESAHMRMLAARAWVRNGASDLHVGERLARDEAVAVRRTLATALVPEVASGQLTEPATRVVEALRSDPHHSVRSVLASVYS